MGVSIWDGVNASPKLVKEMQGKLDSIVVTDRLHDFANDFISPMNQEIEHMIAEGKDVCITNYSIPKFSVYKDKETPA